MFQMTEKFVNFHQPATRYERQATFFEQFAQKMPLHLSRELYKSNLFMQNEPNFKNAQIYTSACNRKGYDNFLTFCRPKNEPKRTQNEPNFRPKLGSFFPIKANFKPFTGDLVRRN